MNSSVYREVVALTGSMGSGKSTVLGMLRALGAFGLSADELARRALAPGSEGLRQVVERFGAEWLRPDGSLDRAALGRRVFEDPQERKGLEAIVHPVVRRLSAACFAEAAGRGYPLYVYEVPLLFETGLDGAGFRRIVVVAAPAAQCLARVVARRGLSVEEARRRLAAQWSLEKKQAGADMVIDNDGSLSQLEGRVEKLFRALSAS